MNRDGTNMRQITSGEMACYQPRWSPDGKWISYYARGRYEPMDSFKVYVVNARKLDVPRFVGYGLNQNSVDSVTLEIRESSTRTWRGYLDGRKPAPFSRDHHRKQLQRAHRTSSAWPSGRSTRASNVSRRSVWRACSTCRSAWEKTCRSDALRTGAGSANDLVDQLQREASRHHRSRHACIRWTNSVNLTTNMPRESGASPRFKAQ